MPSWKSQRKSNLLYPEKVAGNATQVLNWLAFVGATDPWGTVPILPVGP
jgi:hypothetical protein